MSGYSIWAASGVFLTSWRDYALKNVIISAVSFIPLSFLIYCAVRHRGTFETYRNSVYYPAVVQSVGSLPAFFNCIFHYIFVTYPLPTNYFWCTLTRTGTGTTAYSVFSTPTAVAICRFLVILFRSRLTLKLLVPMTFLCAFPAHFYIFYVFTFGIPYQAATCTSMLTMPKPWANYYHYTYIAIALFSLPVNIATLFLIKHRIRQRGSVPGSTNSIDELSITYGLIIQGLMPAITLSGSILASLFAMNGITVSTLFNMIVDGMGYATPGTNTLCSFIFVRTFRRHLRKLLIKVPIVGRLVSISESHVVATDMRSTTLGHRFTPTTSSIANHSMSMI